MTAADERLVAELAEVWRPVVGYEGLYEVSNLGRVRGVDRFVKRGDHAMRILGRLRRQYGRQRDGYVAVSLCRDNTSRSCVVHKLVAEAFIGPRPQDMEVRHLDGDKTNNTHSNLAYGTSLDNKADMRAHGTHGNSKKTHCPKRHPYTPENTHTNSKGYRWCRTCIRERNQKRTAA